MELSVKYYLNTAITGVDINGDWDESEHKGVISPLRSAIMHHDGVTKCFIGRYYIGVWFLDQVTSEAAVFQAVQAAVAGRNGKDQQLFPYLGSKELLVLRGEDHAEPQRHIHRVDVQFGSYLDSPKIGSSYASGFSQEDFEHETRVLAEELINFDGCTGFELKLTRATVWYDDRYTDPVKVMAHLKEVLNTATGNHFPYLEEGEEPILVFEVAD